MTFSKRTPEIGQKAQRVLDLRNQGDYARALDLAKPLMDEYPDNAVVFGIAGVVCFEMDRYEDAARYFKRSTELSPKSETASLGFFHSLWEIGQEDAAFAEIRRFLTISDSEEYRLIIKEMMESLEEDE